MMKIQIASDLHLELLQKNHPSYRIVEPTDADVLILAGDIHNGTQAIERFRDWPVPVVYVHGNHEFYDDEYQAVAQRLAREAHGSVHYLENEALVVGGVRFLGCCLWTDYALYGDADAAMARAREFMSDHRTIRYGEETFQPEHAREIHNLSRAWLEARLEEPFDGKTVVVTHHGPLMNSVHPKYGADLTNAGFSSDLMPLMGKAALWVHGHTHTSFRYRVAGTEVVVNPCGYPHNKSIADPQQLRFENADFNPRLVVEL
jgi:predicted phosphodiesterase